MTDKRRVYYHADDSVSIIIPALKSRRKGESEAVWLKRVYEKTEQFRDGLPFDDIDTSQLPPDRKARDKWRGSKGNGVHVDNTIVTVAEKRQKVEDDLDAELAKPAPNAIVAMRLQRKLDKREYD